MKITGEKEAVLKAISIAEQYGYGNLIAHLQRIWAKKLMNDGIDKEGVGEATNSRTGYPVDFDYLEIDKERKDEYGI